MAAALGALGAALATMVANLSSHRRGWDARWEEFSEWAERGKAHQDALVRLVDEDTDAFNAIMAAFCLPKKTDEEEATRTAAIQAATKIATTTPLRVMREALASMDIAHAMVTTGMESSISDAGVAALCARAAVRGAYLNVQINAKDIDDAAFVEETVREAKSIADAAEKREAEILAAVKEKLA